LQSTESQQIQIPTKRFDIPDATPSTSNAEVSRKVEDIHTTILQDLESTLNSAEILRAKAILFKIKENPRVSINVDGQLTVDGSETRAQASSFVHDLQQSTVKLSEVYLSILRLVKLPSELVKNKHARASSTWITLSR
jgi:hypothetical protein